MTPFSWIRRRSGPSSYSDPNRESGRIRRTAKPVRTKAEREARDQKFAAKRVRKMSSFTGTLPIKGWVRFYVDGVVKDQIRAHAYVNILSTNFPGHATSQKLQQKTKQNREWSARTQTDIDFLHLVFSTANDDDRHPDLQSSGS